MLIRKAFAATAVASLSAISPTSVKPMPDENSRPSAPNSASKPAPLALAGMSIRRTGVPLPAVGADALLYSFRYAMLALLLNALICLTRPALAFTFTAIAVFVLITLYMVRPA